MSDRHICEECGKGLATLGGLEIHMKMAHAPAPLEPEPMEGVEAVAVSVTSADPQPQRVRPEAADARDLTVPLAWALVILLFLGSVAAALANPGPLG